MRVFISYRRSDSRHVAGRLRDRLADAFGEDNVFLDVDSMDFGVDFRAEIRDTVRTVDAVLVVIGPEFDLVRLAEEKDYVRLELAEAFAQHKLIVPVLVEDARMPRAEELPPELGSLSYNNAARLRPDPDFRGDASRLIESLERTVQVADVSRSRNDSAPDVRSTQGDRKAPRSAEASTTAASPDRDKRRDAARLRVDRPDAPSGPATPEQRRELRGISRYRVTEGCEFAHEYLARFERRLQADRFECQVNVQHGECLFPLTATGITEVQWVSRRLARSRTTKSRLSFVFSVAPVATKAALAGLIDCCATYPVPPDASVLSERWGRILPPLCVTLIVEEMSIPTARQHLGSDATAIGDRNRSFTFNSALNDLPALPLAPGRVDSLFDLFIVDLGTQFVINYGGYRYGYTRRVPPAVDRIVRFSA